MKPNTSRLVQTRAPSGVAFLTIRVSFIACLPLSGADTKRIPCAPENGNPFPVLRRLCGAEKIFSKIFSFFALKTKAGALLRQNGNKIDFRLTEHAFLLRLFTGYLQLYPTHTNFCLLCGACATHTRGRILFLNAASRPALCRAAVPPGEKHPARSQRRPIVCRGAQRHRRAQDAKKARPIGRALFGAMIAIHTARVTLPLRRQRVHA